MYTTGVSYYIIDTDYIGQNKELYADVFKIDTLYLNDINICYDWLSSLGYAEDSVTHDMTDIFKLSGAVVNLLETDASVHKWMYRKRDYIDEL